MASMRALSSTTSRIEELYASILVYLLASGKRQCSAAVVWSELRA